MDNQFKTQIFNVLHHGDLVLFTQLFPFWNFKETFISSTTILDCASAIGNIDIVKYLFEEQHVRCTTNAIDLASKYGFTNIVEYLVDKQMKFTQDAINFAVRNGHLKIAYFLYKHRHLLSK